MARTLYLVCYDIANPTRLRRVRKEVRAYAVGGQKSFYECWMTDSEYGELLDTLRSIPKPIAFTFSNLIPGSSLSSSVKLPASPFSRS